MATLKFIPSCFVTCTLLENIHDALLADGDIPFFDENVCKVIFLVNQMGIIGVDLDKINIYYDNNFNKDDLKSIIHFRLFAWRIKFEKCKVFNKTLKRKELMSVG